jgi:hypothetical protein
MNGSPRHDVELPAGSLMTVQSTFGAPTCYVLLAHLGATVLGTTDVLCGVPSVETLPAGATAARRSCFPGQAAPAADLVSGVTRVATRLACIDGLALESLL